MAGDNYFLLTALPALGELGTTPPLTARQLLELLDDAPARALAQAVLLSDDLLEAMAAQAGEASDATPAVLTREQALGQAPLPDYLSPGADSSPDRPGRLMSDALWDRYCRWGLEVARRRGSGFLDLWLRTELALRNALASARAAALGLDGSAYLVAPDLAGEVEDVSAAVTAWSAAPDPLSALRAMDQWRWNWLRRHDGWFTFGDDEIAAYAAKLLLLIRWDRLDRSA